MVGYDCAIENGMASALKIGAGLGASDRSLSAIFLWLPVTFGLDPKMIH